MVGVDANQTSPPISAPGTAVKLVTFADGESTERLVLLLSENALRGGYDARVYAMER